MTRASVNQLDLLKGLMQQEHIRDRSRCHGRISDYHDIIAVLRESLQAGLGRLEAFRQQEAEFLQTQVESLIGHFSSEIAREQQALADLEGRVAVGEDAAGGDQLNLLRLVEKTT